MPTVFFTCLQMSRKDTPLTYITESRLRKCASELFCNIKFSMQGTKFGCISARLFRPPFLSKKMTKSNTFQMDLENIPYFRDRGA